MSTHTRKIDDYLLSSPLVVPTGRNPTTRYVCSKVLFLPSEERDSFEDLKGKKKERSDIPYSCISHESLLKNLNFLNFSFVPVFNGSPFVCRVRNKVLVSL